MPDNNKPLYWIQSGVKMIPIELIDPPEEPLRLEPEGEDISELANSLQSTGMIHPIVVEEHGTRYRIITGHRRYLAAKELGWEEVPCFIGKVEEKQKISIMLAENLARKDLSPMEEASIFREIQDKWHWSNRQIARVIGRTEGYVRHRLKLLEIPNDLQLLVHEGKLGTEHAFVLAEIEDEHTRTVYTEDCIKRKISVATLKDWVASLKAAQVYARGPTEEELEAMKLSAKQKTYYTCQICDGAFEIERMTNILACKPCAIKLMEQKIERNKSRSDT